MIRARLSIVAALLLTAPAPLPAAPPYRHDGAAIVRVGCADRSGTAVKIGPDSYITAAHVAIGSNCMIGSTPIAVTVIDVEADYALFAGPSSNARMPISCRGFDAGRIYLARGYAGGGTDDFAIPWLATEITSGPEIAMFGDSIPGMSGGALIARDGTLRGIVNQRWPARSLPLTETKLCHARH